MVRAGLDSPGGRPRPVVELPTILALLVEYLIGHHVEDGDHLLRVALQLLVQVPVESVDVVAVKVESELLGVDVLWAREGARERESQRAEDQKSSNQRLAPVPTSSSSDG